MPSQEDALEVKEENKPVPKRRFDAQDWNYIAEHIIDDQRTRARKRSSRDLHWDEIDRQVRMEPDIAYKKLSDGRIDTRKAWMSEVEPPLQATALEVITADMRRMLFSQNGPWFRAVAECTDEYFANVDFKAIILGDDAEVPSLIRQDNANKLVQGFSNHTFGQYDFKVRMDRVNAELTKYGMGVGRMRKFTKNVYIHEARGVRKETQRLPVFAPCSIRNTYLDEPTSSMHTSTMLGDGMIARDRLRLENLIVAANRGSNDPDNEDGGWMPDNIKGITADANGYVELLEFEGDLVVPRKTVKSFILPGVIVTVIIGQATGGGGGKTSAVVRFRWRKMPYSSYLLFPYHYEDTDCVYPTSPLEKGRPIQIMVAEAINRMLDSGMLKILPPIGYDGSDQEFAANGGPVIEPGALWKTIENVVVHKDIGGDPGTMSAMLQNGINLYAELTGVLPSRIGAQTVSHTTAFAKDAELSRGAIRTVDYVNSAGDGPMTRLLFMNYDMARSELGSGKVSFYIPEYGGFVEITKDYLPEHVNFEWFGSGGPAEERQKAQEKLASLQLAVQMDQIAVGAGQPPSVNVQAAIQQVLREGGWTDLDAITLPTGAPATPATLPANPGTTSTALQALAFGGQKAA